MTRPAWSLITPTGKLEIAGGLTALRLRHPWSRLQSVHRAVDVIGPTLLRPGIRGIAPLRAHQAGVFTWSTPDARPLAALAPRLPAPALIAYAAHAARALSAAARAGAAIGLPSHGHLLPYVFLCGPDGAPQIIAWGMPEPETLRRRLTGDDSWIAADVASAVPPEMSASTQPTEATDVWCLARALQQVLPADHVLSPLRAALSPSLKDRPTLAQLARALDAHADPVALCRAAGRVDAEQHGDDRATQAQDPAQPPAVGPAHLTPSGDELLASLKQRITPLGGLGGDPLE